MPKCKVKMGDKVLPLDGSVKADRVGDTGTCPECLTPGIPLSVVGGYIRAHVISATETPENNPQAPTAAPRGKKVGKGLTEPVTELVDTGLRAGDPKAAEQRRVAELNGATGSGTVQVPVKGEKGRAKLQEVPATEDNVRAALTYVKGRKPRSDAGRAKQNETLSMLTRTLEAIMEAQAVRYNPVTRALDVVDVPVSKQPALGAAVPDTAAAHRGPTLVPGRDTTPRLRDPELPWDEPTDLRRDGSVKKSTTLDTPRGRDRFDPKITRVPEPAPKLTASQRRRFRRQQQVAALVKRQAKSGK